VFLKNKKINLQFLIDLTRSKIGVVGTVEKIKIKNYQQFNTLITYISKMSKNIEVKYIFADASDGDYFIKNSTARNIAKHFMNKRKEFVVEVSYKADNFTVLMYAVDSPVNVQNLHY
jgi:hypothetical protein